MSYYGDYTRFAQQLEFHCSGQPAAVTAPRRPRRARKSKRPPTFEAIIHHDNLIATYWRLAQNNGQGPGVDGLTYGEMGPREVAHNMRRFSKTIRDFGVYLPNLSRSYTIPKPNGDTRILRIPTILDRVLAAAITDAMAPFWESKFLAGSFGFRPGLSAWQMLAHLDSMVTRENLPVLIVEDIYKAFDNVRLDHLVGDHRLHIRCGSLNWLVSVVLHGWNEQGRRRVGIDQGNPYSPTGLNVRLHHAHDLRMSTAGLAAGWFRFADNFVYASASFDDAALVRDFARSCLAETDLCFKQQGRCCVDLRESTSSAVLGFRLTLVDGRMRYTLSDNPTWSVFADLAEKLRWAHETVYPAQYARAVVNGWVNAFGPAWHDESACGWIRDRLLGELRIAGFSDQSWTSELSEWPRAAWQRWERLRMRVRRQWAKLRLRHGRGPVTVSPE